MKKVIISVIAICFSAQMAFANDLDDLDDVQQAVASVVGEATANAVANTVNAVSTNVNNAATAAAVNGSAAGSNIAGNIGTAGTAGTAAAGLAVTAQQLVALSPAQIAALGIQTNTVTATASTTALIPVAGTISLAAANINGVFLASPTAAGGSSAASIAAASAAIGVADSDEFSYDDE